MSRLASIKNIEDFMDTVKSGPGTSGQKPVERLAHGIVFQSVSFAYQKERVQVLKDVSLTIKKGQKVGIVGRSGSGKTTVAELVLRFYDPSEGQILVDGIDLCEINAITWRSRVGVVAQDVFLFNETIRTNIAFAKPQATDMEVEFAAQQAHIHEFILSLPQSYDTMIGERGVLLSGGQRQRIAIARAILNEPDILIFDEATSALDTESEKLIQEALAEISRGRTVILIAPINGC
jgi:subfamily B ATP-binding cassette protein MsbA